MSSRFTVVYSNIRSFFASHAKCIFTRRSLRLLIDRRLFCSSFSSTRYSDAAQHNQRRGNRSERSDADGRTEAHKSCRTIWLLQTSGQGRCLSRYASVDLTVTGDTTLLAPPPLLLALLAFFVGRHGGDGGRGHVPPARNGARILCSHSFHKLHGAQ